MSALTDPFTPDGDPIDSFESRAEADHELARIRAAMNKPVRSGTVPG